MIIKIFFLVVFSMLSLVGFSQEERSDIRLGNKFYDIKEYDEAEVNYLKALEKQPESVEGSFNLGNVTYRQEKYKDAADRFEMLAKQGDSPEQVANSYYNMGNSLLQSKEYEKSIEAYKNALRNNPQDADAKYNLSYAQAKLKQQQQEQEQNKDQENKDDKKEEEENKDQENKDDKKEEEENKDQENKDQDKKEENQKNEDDKKKEKQENKEGEKGDEEKKPQPRPDQISKEDAQRLLDALKNDEQKIQKDLKKKKARVNKVKIEKDW